MEFVFSDEQDELRAMVRDVLRDHSPESEVRRLMATTEGFDPSVWAQMAEVGLTGLAVPEAYGGAGFGPIEVGVVMEEAGAALLCAPYLSSAVLATEALLAAGDEAACKAYLPGMVDGSLRAALALPRRPSGPAAGSAPPAPTVTATSADGGWRLHGAVPHVLDGATADLVLVLAASEGGTSLFCVEADAPGLDRTPQSTMDATRKKARLVFAATPARLVGVAGAGRSVADRVAAIAAVQLAAEQIGGTQRVLDMAVEYAGLRMQFGRPIGSFQAIKHKCADMLVRAEAARSAAYHALWAAAEDRSDLPTAAAVAGSYCSRTYYYCAEENILIHGGIGYTWEHPAHLYFKRASADRVMFGDPAAHGQALAAGLLASRRGT